MVSGLMGGMTGPMWVAFGAASGVLFFAAAMAVATNKAAAAGFAGTFTSHGD